MSFVRSLSHVPMYSFLSHLFSLPLLVCSYFSFSFLLCLEFYSKLYLIFSTFIFSLLLLPLILYLVLLLLSWICCRRYFGGFVLFFIVLFVWQICPCCCLWCCDTASISYNLFFVLLVILLSQLLVQYKVLLVDWISLLRLYLEFF